MYCRRASGQTPIVFVAIFSRSRPPTMATRRPKRRKRNIKPGFDEIERRKHREGDAAHATYQSFVAKKNTRYDKTDEIRRQNRFAFCGRRKAAKKKQHEKDKLHFRLTH